MKIIYVSVLLFFIILIYGCTPKLNTPTYQPTKKSKKKFEEQLDEGSTYLFSNYYFMVEKTKTGEFVKKTFYPDTKQITHYYTYSDEQLSEQNGYAKEWWDNGDMRFEGNIKDGKRIGEWKDYLKDEDHFAILKGQYVDGEKDGLWLTHNDENILLAETSYKNGKRNGAYKKYSEEGELVEKGIYEDDKITQREVMDSESEAGKIEMKIVEEMPRYKGCEKVIDKEKRKECSDNKMLVFIYSNIRYPEMARRNGVEGRALAKFMIDQEGKVGKVKVMRGVCKEIKAEVERIVKMMPDWHPGIQGGEKVNVWFTLPVSFKFE